MAHAMGSGVRVSSEMEIEKWSRTQDSRLRLIQKKNFRFDRLDDTSGLSITSKTTNRWKSGKNEKKMKSLAAEGWVIKCHILSSISLPPLSPYLSFHLFSFLLKTTFESAVLTTKIMNASTCQRNTPTCLRDVSLASSTGGWEAESGKMKFLCDDMRKNAPTPSSWNFSSLGSLDFLRCKM